MPKRKSESKPRNTFRSLAEKVLNERVENIEDIPINDIKKLVHELEVHQIELKMQNDELRKAQYELSESRNRYSDLYDFAPVGYMTICKKGLIRDANLTVARLLGIERSRLLKNPFSKFVAPEDQDSFFLYRRKLLETKTNQSCQLKLSNGGAHVFHAQLESTVVQDNEGIFNRLLIAVTNITERYQAEKALRRAHDETEKRVEERTSELSRANVHLAREIVERKKTEEALKQSGKDLAGMSSRLLTAHEEESKRIGQELHDGLAQTVMAAKIWVEAALLQMDQKNYDEASKLLNSAMSLAGGAVEEVRRISKNLRPSSLDDFGIVATVSWLFQEFEAMYIRIEVENRIEILEDDIPDSLKIVIYRILQEALNNVAKHSQASVVRFCLRKAGSMLELIINDNGDGFEMGDSLSSGQPGRGLGIISMKERTELSGGSFSIETRKGLGTTVQSLWPLK